MPRGTSWHIPTISSYNVQDPMADLNVVCLQRMTEIELRQVEEALNTVDHEAVQQLNIGESLHPRPLRIKKWIRDYFPSSANTLEIAKAAHFKHHFSDHIYNSLGFVDTAWDLGNVIVAHWERSGTGDEDRLCAVRAPMGIANVLLTACDRVEGTTLSHALRQDAFEQSQVDFYKDLPEDESREPVESLWPSHLPEDMKVDREHPTIVSLRHLDYATIAQLKQDINDEEDSEHQEVHIYNWDGPETTDRLIIRDIHNKVRHNTDGTKVVTQPGERIHSRYTFFIDYMLQGPNGEPQILAVSRIQRDPGEGVEVLPVFTSNFLEAWDKASEGQAMDENEEMVDIWKKEHVDHLNTANPAEVNNSCPIFFLKPFTAEEERRIRASVCALGDVEDGENWGHLFIWLGYIFSDGEAHTLEDLRDLFESSDPLSPFFDREKAGSYRLDSYPHIFVAIDDKALDADNPKVWMASTLDFSGEDTSNELGWTIGRLNAKETSIVFVNLDIANTGPEENFEEETVDKLWLSDLKAYREEDWRTDQD